MHFIGVYVNRCLYNLLAVIMVDYTKRITIEPGKRSGKPCIRGLRITVYDVLEYMAGGMSHEEILEDFPELTPEDLLACLAFAAEREKKLFSLSHEVAVHRIKNLEILCSL